jgi:hypothetical protein
MSPVIPVGVGVIVVWRYIANLKNKGLTPERQAIYSYHMAVTQDPKKLLALADIYEKGGMTEQANNLRARAKLPNVGAEAQTNRQNVMRLALKSKDPNKVMKVADEFEKRGAGATAEYLRQHALGLKVGKKVAWKKLE